jgi:hypothetical protein
MTNYALYVPLEAKPGKEKEVADFLRSAVPLVNAETGTISWFAIQEEPSLGRPARRGVWVRQEVPRHCSFGLARMHGPRRSAAGAKRFGISSGPRASRHTPAYHLHQRLRRRADVGASHDRGG